MDQIQPPRIKITKVDTIFPLPCPALTPSLEFMHSPKTSSHTGFSGQSISTQMSIKILLVGCFFDLFRIDQNSNSSHFRSLNQTISMYTYV